MNSALHDANVTDIFNSRLSDYFKARSDTLRSAESDHTISVKIVDFAMNELHVGKAAGPNQLQVEHRMFNTHRIL